MRSADTVLGIIRERGKRGLPLQDLYRQLYNPDLYLRAYARLYSNNGAMTPGSAPETVDAMSLAKIGGVPAGCGYCFGPSPKPAERSPSAGHHHSKPVFKTPSMSLGLHLRTLNPSTPRSATGILF